MNDEEIKAIERLNRILIAESTTNNIGTKVYISDLRTVLNLIEKQKAEIEKKDNIINNSIIEIEKIRQYFSEDLQVEFIRILEILRDKKVIDW